MFSFLADFLTQKVFPLTANTRLEESVNFFIKDSLEILFLMFVVIAGIALIRTWVSQKLEQSIKHVHYGWGNFLAAIFGAVTPFCSCSSIPIFIGFLRAEVPIGIAFSFLITSPLVNEVALVIIGQFFGWKLALLYAVAGIILGVLGGILLGMMKVDKYILLEKGSGKIIHRHSFSNFNERVQYALEEATRIFKKLYLFIILGVAIGAGIHGYVPQEFIVTYLGNSSLWSIPIAVIIGVPIYAGSATIAPVIFSLVQGGVPLSTAIAFMMSVAGLSLPEAVILKQVMNVKLLAIFFGTVAIGIMIVGFLFQFWI